MQIYDAIEEMAALSGKTLYAVMKEMGRGTTLLSNRSRGTIPKTNMLAEVAGICGYKLALVPRESITGACLTIEPEQEAE